MAGRQRVASGKSIKDIMSMSEDLLSTYTPSQQREIVSRLASATNKRIRSLENKNAQTPSLMRIEESGGKISVKGKSGSELLNEFNRAKRFLQSPSSTVRGWKKQVKEVEKALEDKTIGGVSIEKGMSANAIISNAFALYDVLSEQNSQLVSAKDRYKIAGHIADLMYNNPDLDNILAQTMNWLEKEHNQIKQEYTKLQKENSLGNRLENDIPTRYKRR